MKKLLLAVMFLGGMAAQANEVTNLAHNNDTGIRYNQANSISFIERGVRFVVFTDGTFDFAPVTQVQNYGRRGSMHNAPGRAYGVNFPYSNRGLITYDRWGDVVRVGRNYLNYNRAGQVNEIGTVRLRYKQGRLVRVGDMRIFYNRKGHIVNLIGDVYFGYHTNHWNDWNYSDNNQNWHSRNNKKRKKSKKRQNHRG